MASLLVFFLHGFSTKLGFSNAICTEGLAELMLPVQAPKANLKLLVLALVLTKLYALRNPFLDVLLQKATSEELLDII